MAKWTLKDGAWVPMDTAAVIQQAPTHYGITPGHAPAGFVKSVLAQQKKNKLRRFDLPTDEEINKNIKEDEACTKAAIDISPVVYQSKQDLVSGKIKIGPGVLAGLNKKYYEKIVPFGAVENSDGTTTILPADKAEKINASLPPKPETQDELVTRLKRELAQEKVSVQLSVPVNANPLPGERVVELKDLIETAMDTVKKNRGQTRGRTI